MRLSLRLGVILSALSLFGFGCSDVGPRIVRVPPPPEPIASTSSSTTVPVFEKEIAYLSLEQGSAILTRDGKRVSAQTGMAILTLDQISVTSGTVFLIYPEIGASRLSKGSIVTVVGSRTSSGKLSQYLRLTAGNLWTRLERLLGPEERFSVMANGVVATVRGTGFGVDIKGDDVEVRVAEHEVEVGSVSNALPWSQSTEGRSVVVKQGEGIKLRQAQLMTSDIPDLRTLVHQLSADEMKDMGFVFGVTPLSPDMLQDPRLSTSPTPFSGFAPPTRGVLPSENAPRGTQPQSQGPR